MEPRREHPRVCGENASLGVLRQGKGTPPRMRGKRWMVRTFCPSRNTPVYAGKRVAPLFDPTHRRNTPAYAGKT